MPEHEPLQFESCTVCARTLLVGERSWRYLAPSGEVRVVCTLCKSRAEASGWVPEALAGNASLPRQRPRGRRFGAGRMVADAAARVRRGGTTQAPEDRRPVPAQELGSRFAGPADPVPAAMDDEATEPLESPAQDDLPPDAGIEVEPPFDLTDEAVVGRALVVFNASDQQRQVDGLRRTLGEPRVSIRAVGDERDAAVLVIAWDLSWYEWEVEAGAVEDPVFEVRKGSELSELGEPGPEWNAGLDEEGLVTLAPA